MNRKMTASSQPPAASSFRNRSMRNAQKAKRDEFYTQLSDIETELKHYKAHFRDKTVFCN
jgi:hypothetical protein